MLINHFCYNQFIVSKFAFVKNGNPYLWLQYEQPLITLIVILYSLSTDLSKLRMADFCYSLIPELVQNNLYGYKQSLE